MTNNGSPRVRFGQRFSVLARGWQHLIGTRLAEHGLTNATWIPLLHLGDGAEGSTQTELAARICLDTSSLVRLLDILSRQGLIERRPDPSDGRTRRIFLTPSGRDKIAHISDVLVSTETEALAALSDDEIETILKCLNKIDLGRGMPTRPRQETQP